MALNDSYATVPEYRAAVTKTDTGDDAALGLQLQAVTDHLSERLRRYFGKVATPEVRHITAHGGTELLLPNDMPEIANDTGLVVKVDKGDYTYSTTLVKDTDFWLSPEVPWPGWPYEALELKGTGSLSEWPTEPRAVEITATWGWPAVPGMVRDLTIMTVRNLRDMLEAGSTMAIASFDTAIQYTPDTQRLWLEVVRMYARPTGFA